MTARQFILFDTSLGRCGLVWGERGISGVQLPEGRESATRSRLLRRFPQAAETPPPPQVRAACTAITALLEGEPRDLSAIALDMQQVPEFHRRVYEVARGIAPGATVTYGEIASRLGEPGAARAVGQALGKNPFAIIVPCHRILAAGGKLGGFSANGGVTTKLRMLTIEGARSEAQIPLFDGDGSYAFDPQRATAHLRAADSTLARLIDSVGPFRLELKRTASVFGALLETIVYQQLAGRAAETIFARVCALVPRTAGGPTAEQLLRVSDTKLRGAGLSNAKLLALRDLARKARDGAIPTLAALREMDDDAIVEQLTAVRGIGRWTAEMLLIFRLGRPDVLPLDDYGVRKGFAVAFRKRELPARADLERRGERWRPYRTVASWYLWRAAERGKE